MRETHANDTYDDYLFVMMGVNLLLGNLQQQMMMI
jgi:hypothetical protein